MEYKKEAFELFENLLTKLKLDFITIIMNLKIIEKEKETNVPQKNQKIVNNPKCLYFEKK